MSNWDKCRFRDLLAEPTRNGIHKGVEFQGRGTPVVKMGEVYSSKFVDDNGERDFFELSDLELSKLTIQMNDLLFCRTSLVADGVGRCAIVRKVSRPTSFASNLIRVRLDSKLADPGFYHFVFQSAMGMDFMRSIVRGTSVSTITGPDISNLIVPKPPLAEQRAIAGVLGALDDKIESNHRLAKTAADLCDQIFLAASDVQCQISEAGQVTMGSSPPGDTYNTDGVGVPFYQGVTDFGFLFPTRRVWTTSPIRGAKVGETLVSVRAPVGRLNEASEQCCIGRGVAAISSSFQTTLYYALRQADAVWAPFEGEGTVFGSINKGDLEGARIAWISPDRISELENELMDIHQCVRASIRELHSLTSLRDALLPELLSGRLRVRDAESMMENM